jgi:hypothetical protein
MCIRVVHDSVLGRAQSLAQEIGADVAAGLRQVFENPCVQGVLVLDADWYGLVPVEFACAWQKPLFYGGNWHDSPAEWRRLAEQAQAHGVMLVPELPLRFHPSTTRLRELIATRLGPVRQIQLRVRGPHVADEDGPDRAVAAAIDWCSYVTRRPVEQFAISADSRPERAQWNLFFRPDPRGFSIAPAEISRELLADGAEESEHFSLFANVTCENGFAALEGQSDLRWSMTGAVEVVEHLGQERPDVEVMLDQFCRRLVGALIPTATLGDVAVAMEHVLRLKN